MTDRYTSSSQIATLQVIQKFLLDAKRDKKNLNVHPTYENSCTSIGRKDWQPSKLPLGGRNGEYPRG